ncbi:MaoC family dehydratase [Gordonia jinhuaensis]|uniref:MaoC family dehydratase n=1 Tax=Gordonia jinhuaensis TaxID=1517702 RepID=A0A916X053_9ACTN|nr:MaoC family dehydratase [Gordonia jinhuaensis]GGB46379.1 MaoC family dehydratase [Gordonia jinhuaensis]
MYAIASRDDLVAAVGVELGHSDWLLVDQDRVNTFADATGDHQWIHVDVERATKESPFGGPIAHGYLTLSLVPVLASQVYKIDGARLLVNYGSNKVRFVAPVPVGSRIRLSPKITVAEPVGENGFQVVVGQTVEIEGADKPALVAETITRVYY